MSGLTLGDLKGIIGGLVIQSEASLKKIETLEIENARLTEENEKLKSPILDLVDEVP